MQCQDLELAVSSNKQWLIVAPLCMRGSSSGSAQGLVTGLQPRVSLILKCW